MKKRVAFVLTAVFAVSMASAVFADDVTVRTSIGSGEVVFTETSEAADITAEELTELVKGAIKEAEELDVFNAFLDAEAAVALKLDEENQMELNASAIGVMDKNQEDGYASLYYSLDGFGDPQSASYEAYHWVKDDTHYTAVSDGSDWTVRTEDMMSEALEQLSASLDSEQADNFTLDALLPNLYEENGEKYYVCVYDKGTVMDTVGNIEGVGMYASLADGIIGDNDVQLIVVVNAQTGLPRAISLNASGASGQLPGELFGGEGAIEFSAEDLYFTLLTDTDAQEIEIPEEVLNAPVESDDAFDLNLGEMMDGLEEMAAEN